MDALTEAAGRAGRRVLVVGSQCEEAGDLTFLPDAKNADTGLHFGAGSNRLNYAQDIYDLFTDPTIGACQDALGGSGPMINPDLSTLQNAVTKAWQDTAALDDTVLLLVFIGHGESADKYYFRQMGSSEADLGATSFPLIERLRELFNTAPPISGVGLLVDTCDSGSGIEQAKARIYRDIGGLPPAINALCSCHPGTNSYYGQFTAALVNLLREGDADCKQHQLSFEQASLALKDGDFVNGQNPGYWASAAGLYFALNRAATRGHPLGETAAWDRCLALTRTLQSYPALETAASRLRRGESVAVVGAMGAGKSTIAAAIQTDPKEPTSHGIVFLSAVSTLESVSNELHEHFRAAHPPFGDAVNRHRDSMPPEDYGQLSPDQRLLTGPLAHLSSETKACCVLDGIEQVNDPAWLTTLLQDLHGAGTQLLITARSDAPLPTWADQTRLLDVGAMADKDLDRYLRSRQIASRERRQAIIERAAGNWLLCAKMAERQQADPGAALPDGRDGLDDALDELYEDELKALRSGKHAEELERILCVLATAGTAVATPLTILAAACARLGAPNQRDLVRRALARAPGLVVRTSPSTQDESIALFHDSLRAHLQRAGKLEARFADALLDTIAVLAPHNTDAAARDSDLFDFARLVEPSLLWQLGKHGAALGAVLHHAVPSPADNLANWHLWRRRAESDLGPDHPDTLTTRNNIASWTGETGDARAALDLFAKLLPDRQRVLGPDHPDTLGTRHNIAAWTGETGDARAALDLFAKLLPDQQRVLGPDHPTTLGTRNNIAGWTGETGDARAALDLFAKLLPDRQRVLGPDHPTTLTTRNNIAAWTGRTGDARAALDLFAKLLPDHQRVLGPDHPTTLTTRNNIAHWTGETGDARAALDLFAKLLPDHQRVLGPDHPDTLTTRNNIAALTGRTGDARAALDLFAKLLPDQQRVLGPDHPDTLTTRNNIAAWTGRTGDARAALDLFAKLLPDQQRVLGPDHPDTLTTRNNIAAWTGRTGDARAALDLFAKLLPDQQRVLGPDHPDTLTTRNNIAAWTGQTGDARAALDLFAKLLPDQQRVLGPDHPDTLTTRNNIAGWTGETGDARAALDLFAKLLPDQQRVLGPDHPDTLGTRNNIAALTGETGDARAALDLFAKLLPDQQRVLGPDHPDTLTTRNNIAALTGETGDARAALDLFAKLLPDQQRVLGPDHPDTLTTRNNIAGWTGRTGDARAALDLFAKLLPDRQRVLGPDHPTTLGTRHNIAALTDKVGQSNE